MPPTRIVEVLQMMALTTLILIGSASAVTKTWNKDINFNNKDNWDKSRLPCLTDRVIIPEESTSLFLQVNDTLREVILPMTGEVVLGSDVAVAFSDDISLGDTSCEGQDITFTRKEPESWLNPDNWDSDSIIPIASDRIPCEYDNVLFPPKKRFLVGIEGNIRARSFSIGAEVLHSSQASSFIFSPDGQSQFHLSAGASVSLTGLACGDVTGCSCGNSNTEVLDKICAYMKPCPEVLCPKPVNPVGACCPLCGAFLTLNYEDRSFRFEDVKSKLEKDNNIVSGSDRMIKRDTEDVVVYLYMSKIEPGKVQVVLTDNGPGADNGNRASQVARQISEDLEGDPAAFGLLSSEVSVSSQVTGDHGGFKMGAPTAAIVVVLVAIILGVSIIYVMCKKQRLQLPALFMLKKDEPLDADIEMPDINQKYLEEVQPEVTFDNPMYGKPDPYYDPTKKSSDGSDSSVEELGSIDEDEGGFSNPMAVTTQ